jgi:hypothetical protein
MKLWEKPALTEKTVHKMLQLNPTTLDFTEKRIGNKGFSIILESVLSYKEPFQLRTLELTGNNLTDDIIPELIQFCKHTLTPYINLEFNSIKDTGLQEFGIFLSSNTTIVKLNLNRNQISDSGVEFLFRDSRKNKTLRWISLYGNKITNKGGIAIIRNCSKNIALVHLDVKNNDLDDEIEEVIRDIVRKNKREIKPDQMKHLPSKYEEKELISIPLVRSGSKISSMTSLASLDRRSSFMSSTSSILERPSGEWSDLISEKSDKSVIASPNLESMDLIGQVRYLKNRVRELEKRNYELESFVGTIKKSLAEVSKTK